MTPSAAAAPPCRLPGSSRLPRCTPAPAAVSAAAASSERARPVTSCPAPSSSATTADPMNPVAPVTNTRMRTLQVPPAARGRLMSVTAITLAQAMTVTVIEYDQAMGRWEPNARGRLERAALELYSERGFDQTTVAEIAERAGLTERTFFRHFADKREVLFGGQDALRELIVTTLAEAPESTAPIEAVGACIRAAGAMLQGFSGRARQRQAVIDANPELQERELIKLATLATAIAAALRQRGVPDPAASLAAEAGIAVFRIAFERWVSQPGDGDRDLPQLIQESLDELKAVTTGG